MTFEHYAETVLIEHSRLQRLAFNQHGENLMARSTEYQGHRSWNAWNVSLYIANEESLYREGVDCLRRTKTLGAATRLFLARTSLAGTRTPDGAVYNALCVKLALQGLEIDQAS